MFIRLFVLARVAFLGGWGGEGERRKSQGQLGMAGRQLLIVVKNWLLYNVFERILLKRVQTWDTSLAGAITSSSDA